MKRTALFWSLVALTSVMVAPALAQSVTPQALALHQVLQGQHLSTDAPNDPKWRASLATALHRYCESVMAQVPRNTPEEDRWVDDEQKDINATIPPQHSANIMDWKELDERWARHSARHDRLLGSVELARQRLRDMLGDCSRLTSELISLKSAKPAVEALLWVQLLRYFMVEDLVWGYAEIVGLVLLQAQ
jgi:hypothetical protein